MARRKLGETSVGFMINVLGGIGTGKSNLASSLSLMKNKDGSSKKVILFDVEGKSIEAFNERYLMSKGLNPDNFLEIRTQDVKLIERICVDYISKGLPIPEIEFVTTKENMVVNGKVETKEVTREELMKTNYTDADGKPFIADVVILDSATVYQDIVRFNRTEFAKVRATNDANQQALTGDKRAVFLDNKSGLQIQDYSKTQNDVKKLLNSLRASSGIMVVIVDHLKKVKVKDPNGKNQFDTIETGEEIPSANDFKDVEKLSSIIVRTDGNNSTGNQAMKFNVQKDCLNIFGIGQTHDFETFLVKINDYVNGGTFTQKVTFEDAVESGVKAEVVETHGKDNRVENQLQKDFREALEKDQDMKKKILESMLNKGKTLEDLTEEEMIKTIKLINKNGGR